MSLAQRIEFSFNTPGAINVIREMNRRIVDDIREANERRQAIRVAIVDDQVKQSRKKLRGLQK